MPRTTGEESLAKLKRHMHKNQLEHSKYSDQLRSLITHWVLVLIAFDIEWDETAVRILARHSAELDCELLLKGLPCTLQEGFLRNSLTIEQRTLLASRLQKRQAQRARKGDHAHKENPALHPHTQQLPDPLAIKIRELARVLDLDTVSRDILLLAAIVHDDSSVIYDLTECSRLSKLGTIISCVATMLGHDRSAVRHALCENGALVRRGIIEREPLSHFDLEKALKLSAHFQGLLKHGTSEEEMQRPYVMCEGKGRCTKADYPYLAREFEFATKLLREALKKKRQGTNILLFGASGTGKTEFAKALVAELGAEMYEALENSPLRDDDTGGRLNNLLLTHKTLARAKTPAIVLVDNAEELVPAPCSPLESGLDAPGYLSASRSILREVLEYNPCPSVWIASDISKVDKSWLRRFRFLIEFPNPPQYARRALVERMTTGVSLSREYQEKLASMDLSPGDLMQALETVRMAGEATDSGRAEASMNIVLREILKLKNTEAPAARYQRYADFDPQFLNFSGDAIVDILQALERKPSATLLLSGPPGTGKTGFGHYLAHVLQKPLLRRTASDILSMWVGESEKNIAKLFDRARSEDAILLLDEAEGLVRDRSLATRSWEVSQVNELLARMEEFDGIFLCCTNHREAFDPAAMRRFLFKLHFDYLDASRCLKFFLRDYPEEEENSAALLQRFQRMRFVTPAEFTNVRKRAQLLNKTLTGEAFLERLEQETLAKKENGERRIGFQ